MNETMISSGLHGVLRIQMPDGKKLEYVVNTPKVTIGRAPENDLVIDHPSVSRRHAQLSVKTGELLIEDLGSSNGTFLDGVRLQVGAPRALPASAALRLGEVRVAAIVPGGDVSPAASAPTLKTSAPVLAIPARPAPEDVKKRWMRIGLIGAIVGVALLLLFLGGRAVVLALRGDAGRIIDICDMPAMRVLVQGGDVFGMPRAVVPVPAGMPGSTTTNAGDDHPILSLAFLDLPFPYDGGNVNFGGTREQFLLAIQRKSVGGRMNSYFDHMLPLYPASKDPNIPGGKEPKESPVGQNLLLFDGTLSPYEAYSGHPALDISTFVFREPTTPVFAAANGRIYAVGTHSSGALFVKLVHEVPGVGNFMTIYWHLNPDEYFDAMLGREGEEIAAGTRIGTMGNTGFSTGHHLHFEVRFDANQDGVYSNTEAVDPFGYIPSVDYPNDPWQQATGFPSPYLWIYPMGTMAEVPANGGGGLPDAGQPGGTGGIGLDDGGASVLTLCVKPKTLPSASTVYFSQTPAPAAGGGLRSAKGCALSVFDTNGNPVVKFGNPIQVIVPFNEANLHGIDQATLQIYWRISDTEEWEPLQTTLDMANGLAYAYTDRPGHCALMGSQVGDLEPPLTAFSVDGSHTPEGTFFDVVTVTLQSSDPSGVARIDYSLDNGTNWLPYSGPFKVMPSGIPNKVTMSEEFFGGVPGVTVVLASAVDSAGNVEDPPAMFSFAIDPSKNPEGTLDVATEELPTISRPTIEPKLPPPAISRPFTPITGVLTTTAVITTAVEISPTVAEKIPLGPDTFPPGTDPLTGLPCTDSNLLDLPPALISVTNFPVTARPQAGLSFSPYVFEMYIGEGMTRFLAMFYCNFPKVPTDNNGSFEPPSLGPIRSGRLPYDSLRKLYNGFLVMASASAEVGTQLSGATSIYGSDENDINSALIGVDKLKDIALNNSLNRTPGNLTGNLFDSTPPEGGRAAPDLWMFYNFLNQTLWTYNNDIGSYLRFQDQADGSGKFVPSSDRINGQQLGFENVVVLFADHSVLNSEGTLIDISLLYTYNVAYLFRDGNMYEIYWTTENGDYERQTGLLRPIRFVDKNFQPFPLKPGRTWVHIVDMTTTIQEVDPGYWKVRFYQP